MSLLFDFTVDKETKTINITREFAAGLDAVWDAFTKAEILDQWVAPKPFRAKTKEMDFREGGRWLYAMVTSNEVPSRYSLAEYIRIDPKSFFTTRNCFSDENGKQISDVFSITTNSFKEGTGVTTVYIEKKFDDLASIEMMVAMGFKEGTAAGLNNLDEYLLTLTAK